MEQIRHEEKTMIRWVVMSLPDLFLCGPLRVLCALAVRFCFLPQRARSKPQRAAKVNCIDKK
jgi:hypothetical protein